MPSVFLASVCRPAPLLAGLAVGLAAALPLLSTLDAYFLSDDFGLIHVYAGKPALHFLTLFLTPWTDGVYGARPDELRPTVALSYRVDALWGAANPFGYHLGNIGLHVTCSLLVLALARRLAGLEWPAATFAALAFALMPVNAEVGAWISGRADSIPAMFYLGSLLAFGLWRQRMSSHAGDGANPVGDPTARLLFGVSVVLFFGGLFTKQSAITMLATLVTYDVLVGRRLPWSPWGRLLAYVPFAVLTGGYLALRMVLFGNAVREQHLSLDTLAAFALVQATYLSMVATGSAAIRAEAFWILPSLIGLLAAVAGVAWALPAILSGRAPRHLGAAAFFGPTWWMITVAPLAMTYVSARHLYLVAAGFAVLLGVAFAWGWGHRARFTRGVAVAGAGLLLVVYAATLHEAVAEWNSSGALSRRMLLDLQRIVETAPAGSLVVFNAPATNVPFPVWHGSPAFAFPGDGTSRGDGRSPAAPTLIWAWAAPFVYGPPFAAMDLAARVSFVEPPGVFCCPADQWLQRTQATIAAWRSRPERPPVVVVIWDDASHAMRSGTGDARAREPLERILSAQSPGEASALLHEVFRTLEGL